MFNINLHLSNFIKIRIVLVMKQITPYKVNPDIPLLYFLEVLIHDQLYFMKFHN